MLDHTVLHNISIDKYNQEIFLIIMLADGVYITIPLNMVRSRGNIQHSIVSFTQEKHRFIKK